MDRARYHWRSIRLKGYDYTQSGACFVTLVTQNRVCLFGEIVGGRPVPGSISTIIRAFKSATTHRINEWRGAPGARVWQRNYREHIIRNEKALECIRRYIVTNPARWQMDRENPYW